jgi:hypothetical protein
LFPFCPPQDDPALGADSDSDFIAIHSVWQNFYTPVTEIERESGWGLKVSPTVRTGEIFSDVRDKE